MKAIRLKEKGKEPMVFNTNDKLAAYWGVRPSDASQVMKVVDKYKSLCKKYNIESIEYTDDFVMPQEYIDKGYKRIQCAGRLIYAANKEGEIICIVNGKKMNYQLSPDGYNIVVMNCKRYTVHRIIAKLFVPNPNSYPIVNHKNEIKTDNRAENLEWCDNKYNTNYGQFKEKCSAGNTAVRIKAIKDGKEFIFESMSEASRITGVDTKSIRHCLRGKRKTAKNFLFFYL